GEVDKARGWRGAGLVAPHDEEVLLRERPVHVPVVVRVFCVAVDGAAAVLVGGIAAHLVLRRRGADRPAARHHRTAARPAAGHWRDGAMVGDDAFSGIRAALRYGPDPSPG